MERKRLGLALCGSYCTYETLFAAAEPLAQRYELVPILSDTAAETDSRFGTAAEHIRRLMGLTGREVVTTIPEAEPLGPAEPLDALLIAPCTGNTLARLAHGLTDSTSRRALRLGREHRTAFKPQAFLLCALRAGRSGKEALLAAGGLLPAWRDGGSCAAGRAAPAFAAALRESGAFAQGANAPPERQGSEERSSSDNSRTITMSLTRWSPTGVLTY